MGDSEMSVFCLDLKQGRAFLSSTISKEKSQNSGDTLKRSGAMVFDGRMKCKRKYICRFMTLIIY